jgi:hypothetical protein
LKATAGFKATAEKTTTPGTPTKAGNPATVRTSAAKGMPAAAKMLATSGTHSLAGALTTAIMQETTRAAEKPETVLQYLSQQLVSAHRNLRKTCQNGKI